MKFRHVTLVLIAVAAATPAAASAPTVALLPVVGQGFGTDEIARVEKTLQAEVDARFGKQSVGVADVRARLDAASETGLRCDRSEVECLVQLGIVVRSDRVITAMLAPKGAAIQLALRLVDVNNAEQLAYAAGPATAEPTREEARALLDALDQPAARATLVTVTGPRGALVVIDGKNIGTLPLAPLTDVSPGKHAVSVIAALRHDVSVDVRRGEPVEIDAPVPAPPKLAGGIGLSGSALDASPALESASPAAATVPGPQARGPATPPPSSSTTTSALPARAPLVVHEPGVLPWVGIAGGGAGVVAGGVAFAAGLSPMLAYNQDAATLKNIESEVGADKAELDRRSGDIEATRKSLDGNAAAWLSWGAPTAIAGVVVAAVGAGALVAGLLTVDE